MASTVTNENEDLLQALRRLVNPGAFGVKTLVPLRLNGGTNVPLVSGLKIIRKRSFVGGTEVTLSWINPEDYRDHISRFQVYVTSPDRTTPTVVAEPLKSPVTIPIQTVTTQAVSFRVQTILKNGQVSDYELSPTASTTVTSLEQELEDLVLVTYVPQPLVYDGLNFGFVSDTATLLNTSGGGKLIGIGIRVLTNIVDTSPTGTTMNIVITYGTSSSTINVYFNNAGNTTLNPAFLQVLGSTGPTGLVAGDFFFLPLGDTEFQNGATVTATSSAGGGVNVGTIGLTLIYAIAL